MFTNISANTVFAIFRTNAFSQSKLRSDRKSVYPSGVASICCWGSWHSTALGPPFLSRCRIHHLWGALPYHIFIVFTVLHVYNVASLHPEFFICFAHGLKGDAAKRNLDVPKSSQSNMSVLECRYSLIKKTVCVVWPVWLMTVTWKYTSKPVMRRRSSVSAVNWNRKIAT